MDFYDAVHILEVGSHLLESCKDKTNTRPGYLFLRIWLFTFHKDRTPASTTHFMIVNRENWSKCVTFSHVSWEPVSHLPFTEVKNSPEFVDIAESLIQFHVYLNKILGCHLLYLNLRSQVKTFTLHSCATVFTYRPPHKLSNNSVPLVSKAAGLSVNRHITALWWLCS